MEPTQTLPVPQGCTCGNDSKALSGCYPHPRAPHTLLLYPIPSHYTPYPPCTPWRGAERLLLPSWGCGWSSEHLPPFKCLGKVGAPREGHEHREGVDE